MSLPGVARKAKSATNFFQTTTTRAEDNQQPASKRLRSEPENDNMSVPAITITNSSENLHASDSAITVLEVPVTGNLNVHDVTKLERLVDKCDRYESHKSFLQQCIQDKIIPVGLQINLTPTIGNNDDEFVDKWHKRLEEFSLTIMQDIADFCENTYNVTAAAVEETKTKVQTTATGEESQLVMESINNDQKVRKENLRRGKQKKIRFLKYKQNNLRNNNFQTNASFQGNNNHHGNNFQNNNNFRDNNFQNNNNNFRDNNNHHGNNNFHTRTDGQDNTHRQDNNNSQWTQRDYRNPHNNINQPRAGQANSNLSRQTSNTQLGRKRSDNRLQHPKGNRMNNEQPKLWSSLLKPEENNPGASTSGNQQTSETETMQGRINELEEQLARKEHNNNTVNQSKNSQTAPRNSGGDMSTRQTTAGTPESPRENEIHDILQVISTTMATLKDFESRYKNARST